MLPLENKQADNSMEAMRLYSISQPVRPKFHSRALHLLLWLLATLLYSHFSFAQNQHIPIETIAIPAGDFIAGSNQQERETAYQLDEAAYNHSITRTNRWYDFEHQRHTRSLQGFSIMKTPVTRCDYARFINDTDYPKPQITQSEWDAQRLIHSYHSTLKFQWLNDSPNNLERCQHPVVLVSHADAVAYASWLTLKTGQVWRLPTEFEWEKAARGTNGNLFPWGDQFDPGKLNSHDAGPFDTIPVGTFNEGASPYGVLDVAGQVFEWTSTADKDANKFIVKGGSWDDKGCGVCRPAARHFRPKNIKHSLIGFRLVTEKHN